MSNSILHCVLWKSSVNSASHFKLTQEIFQKAFAVCISPYHHHLVYFQLLAWSCSGTSSFSPYCSHYVAQLNKVLVTLKLIFNFFNVVLSQFADKMPYVPIQNPMYLALLELFLCVVTTY